MMDNWGDGTGSGAGGHMWGDGWGAVAQSPAPIPSGVDHSGSMPLNRRFRDAAGILNQRIAAVSAEVVFMAAGLPLHLKIAS